MLDNLKKDIETKLFNAEVFEGAVLPPVDLTPAPPHTGADISLTWAMSAAKTLKKNPLEIAKAAVKVISEVTFVASASYAAPGFINIILEDSFISSSALDRRLKNRKTAGENKERVLIEFVSANPTGPLHVASGRGASLGDSLVRIFNALGIQCDSEYYVNDSGNQAMLLGVSLKARVNGQEPPENGYHGSYLIEMADEIREMSKDWTEEQFSIYAIEYLIKTHQRDMQAFNVNFTRWFRESELYKESLPAKALDFLKEKGLAYEADGAVWFGTTKDNDDKDRVLVRADGRPTYFLADIAYHKNKYDRGFTTLVDILGADHHGYVPRMKAAVKALGENEESFVPIIHQLVHLIEGGEKVKMSKRSGRFITLKELTEEVGADACRFLFASRTPDAHMNFDIDLAKKRTNENPVFYVQYVHARAASIARMAEQKHLQQAENLVDFKLTPQERTLLIKILWFKHALKNCVRDMSPHHLTTYLIELAGNFHSFYDACRVVDEDNPQTTAHRLLICDRVRERIKKGLEFLGVSAPEEM
ncbi:Arginyl-tRNA synthetase [Elusimicrobium minutum Pei191]|uniref:Arginine--tRNA ligase n=1 Tax=Elusimicrobium minutum (strain Pei191) TaxID=445932 RepID=SYR_ELUMP|nr:arginine--tRNA ligase [Elusimicrobium minutum]B2KD56.1 RecName: Full=Arginine--tRNA ligase; AltName: Full=Arginyl-tRNA synthetase; Short=ArgRS [Elusimicrobium minutum Pei191]ACC98452.1 Arginyl-tRNA synthetase [Elusimicrobium minutum Pei191]